MFQPSPLPPTLRHNAIPRPGHDSRVFHKTILPLTFAIYDPRFLVDQLPTLGLPLYLCIW